MTWKGSESSLSYGLLVNYMHASLHACKGILKEREGQKYAKEGLWFSAIRKGKAQRKYRKRRGVIDVASVGDSLSRILFIP